MKRISVFTTLLIISLFLLSCSNKQPYRRARLYMGTTVEFNISSGNKSTGELKKVCNMAESRIAELDKMLSIFDESSVVSSINNDKRKEAVEAPQELFQLIKRAKEYFMLTGGAFDITVEPFTEIWGFGPEQKTAPDIQKIKETLQYVGLDKIGLDEGTKTLVFKDPRTRLDFGGVAKGYAVDEAVKIFKKNGMRDGLVNMGGDLYCMGAGPDGGGWSIGIRDPESNDKILVVLDVCDKAIATSGTYENFYIYNRKRYSHIIDPRSGLAVENNITSATIIADDCATADALATAVFVLGEYNALVLIEKLTDIECLLVTEKNGRTNIATSSGMKRYIKRDGT